MLFGRREREGFFSVSVAAALVARFAFAAAGADERARGEVLAPTPADAVLRAAEALVLGGAVRGFARREATALAGRPPVGAVVSSPSGRSRREGRVDFRAGAGATDGFGSPSHFGRRPSSNDSGLWALWGCVAPS